ncbi:acetylornithine deacetylase/succinyl-diaminopimelate desuccinylase-like protein [Serratia fonticola]|uniref:Acetylornithine deacetylase/succinyl-diaminopimelate desuccinylase-like protein n=1 Tax=Serratia fonticola TaxID=47917 RepID=A0A559T953_SERFO|nr:M20 family metallopeptidase [Serratia fonticola]TQI81335.1 acetylornithine deacetylase/succinyl-diaminopimelate desuccinylase-like protein [Serratia fonticola]TQI96642.1 acetylornithine deacetylase/succinyl-diaminopimelate desuccinylase-like protein [Serratia fonticola]TVZ71138.1 acetylornithine deacetylase/succinyl-diaminopimelate desuccinylase-like protein [Serratia fonticola]
MTAEQAVALATAYFDRGEFRQVLARRVALATESQRDDGDASIMQYLEQEIMPPLRALGFELHLFDNPEKANRPFLVAVRIEDPALPTLLSYGHGDVVFGDDENWRNGLSPWILSEEGDRWYGRGSADNKGQHSVNLAALEHVFQARGGKLGFNCKIIFEMGEEISSPGLAAICHQQRELLQADLFIASDGPRLNAAQPTLFLGSRGCINFRLSIHARENAYHSGNWGGLLSNPGTQLANAIAALVNQQGQLLVTALKPTSLDNTMRAILQDLSVGGQAGDPTIDENWGENGLSPSERLYGWNTLEVLAYQTGNPARPVNAIPGSASAICQLRFVVGTDWQNLVKHVQEHLQSRGFSNIEVEWLHGSPATRLNPQDPLVHWALDILQRASGKKPALLPNLGGSLPNDVFADTLGLPTLWIPHSYPACGQHGVNEHMLKSIAREGLQIMTHLFWELGENGSALLAQRQSGETS